MSRIGGRASAGARTDLVTLRNPGPPVATSDGGYTQSWIALDPAQWASIHPASQRDLERLAAGTVLTTSALVVVMPFTPGVTSKTRLDWVDAGGRAHAANAVSAVNLDGRCVELSIVCVEVVI